MAGAGGVSIRWRGYPAAAAARAVVERTAVDLKAAVQSEIVGMGAVDTGNMLNSVTYEMTGILAAMITSPAPYSIYVHNGTYRMAARPFFAVALATIQDRFRTELQAVMTP